MTSKTIRFFKYFSSLSGRKLVYRGACFTGMSLFLANYLPHSLLINNYREFIQRYRYGFEEKVPTELLNRVHLAFDKLKLSQLQRDAITPFMVNGFDVFQAGTTRFRSGAILGLPDNFRYKSILDVDRSDITLRGKPIKWDSEDGQKLQDALLFTEDEQVFAICKAILQVQTNQVLLNSMYPVGTLLCVYTVGYTINQKLQLFLRPMSLRIVLYTLLGLFGLGTWSFLKDYTQISYETYIDKILAAQGKEFIDAGIRYYDKILKRNIALHNILGGKYFSALGNENFYIRQKTLPLTLRKMFFEIKMEEIKNKIQETPNEIS